MKTIVLGGIAGLLGLVIAHAQPAPQYGPSPPPVTGATLNVSGATSNGSGAFAPSLPASGYIGSAMCRETAGFSVSAAIGSSSGGSDVAPTFNVPANGTTTVTTQAFSKVWFSATAPQPLFVSSASWGGARLNCQIAYQPGP